MGTPGQDGHGHTALVTGASSGIGRSIAVLMASRGYSMVLVARRRERLDDLATELSGRYAISAVPMVADLADPSAPARLCQDLTEQGIGIDFLVNNAGYALAGTYDQTTWEAQEELIRVNAVAPAELTHRLLPAMLEAGWGRILNVSSIAALTLASPRSILYASTKSMLLHFSEGLRLETRGTGVHCTVSLPGVTATEFFERSGMQEHMASGWAKRFVMSPDTVALAAYAAVMADKPRVVHGWHHRIAGAVLLHSPTAARRKMATLLDAR